MPKRKKNLYFNGTKSHSELVAAKNYMKAYVYLRLNLIENSTFYNATFTK